MKITSWVLLIIGGLLAAASLGGAAWGISQGSFFNSGEVVMTLSLVVSGVIMVMVGLYLRGVDNTAILANGVSATAQVQSVQDTGVTINNFNMVLKVGLLVTVPGAPAYTARTRVMLGRTSWGAIQPGMTVPVKVDPRDPSRVAIDLYGAGGDAPEAAGTLLAATPQVLAQAVNVVLGQGGAPAGAAAGMITMKAADIIRDGLKTEGKLISVTPTGLLASQAAGGLAPDEGDDPLVVLVFTWTGEGGREETSQGLARVPDGKAAFLAPGAKVPVAYLAGRPETATIDWSRLV